MWKTGISELTPVGCLEGGAADGYDNRDEDATPREPEDDRESDAEDDPGELQGRVMTPAFPSSEGDRNALSIRLVTDEHRIKVSHWADGSSRDPFKLYSGNRSAKRIATRMLRGARAKPKKGHSIGELKNRGLQQLSKEQCNALLEGPFDVVTPTSGSSSFDPGGAWTAIDAGYSPNTRQDGIAASPVEGIFAAIGPEHARPDQYATRKVRYAVWGQPLPPTLARGALAAPYLKLAIHEFRFESSPCPARTKVTTFAQ
jgi:CRISPR-associated protein Csx14